MESLNYEYGELVLALRRCDVPEARQHARRLLDWIRQYGEYPQWLDTGDAPQRISADQVELSIASALDPYADHGLFEALECERRAREALAEAEKII